MTGVLTADELRAAHLGLRVIVEYGEVELQGRLDGYAHTASPALSTSAGVPLRYSAGCDLTFEFGTVTVPRDARVLIRAH